jgi:hypothetical protein
MSAPPIPLVSSISSSGYTDGLGRRVLAFDRETGVMLERLYVRPELAVFEGAIRERVTRFALFRNERFARPSSVERDPITRQVSVLSEFLPGSRLADLIETAQEQTIVPGVDVALGYLFDALPALSAAHTALGFAHGLVDPGRTLLTSQGHVVFVDAAYGAVVEKFGLSPHRLWIEFGIASPAGSAARIDITADIGQAALSAVMLVLGRKLQANEYPKAIPGLLTEVVEIARIRGTAAFASGIERVLQRSLPLPGRRPYLSADEMVIDIRQLVRREIGLDVCRDALIRFVRQMDRASAPPAMAEPFLPAAPQPIYENDEGAVAQIIDTIERIDDQELPAATSVDSGDDDRVLEFEICFDEEPGAAVYELPGLVPKDPASAFVVAAEGSALARPSGDDLLTSIPKVTQAADASRAVSEPETTTAAQAPLASDLNQAAPAGPVDQPQEAAGSPPQPATTAAPLHEETPAKPVSSRRKRHQQKSARARKDRLQSTATPKPPAQEQKPQPSKSGWLVPPERATVFEPAVVEPPRPTATPVFGGLSAPPSPAAHIPAAPHQSTPAYQPAVVAPIPPQPIPPPATAPAARVSPYGVPTVASRALVVAPVPVAPVAGPPIIKTESPALRIKSELPPGYAPPKRSRIEPPPVAVPTYAQRAPMFSAEPARSFPWKLAAAAVVIVGAGIVAGRAYMPSRSVKQTTVARPATEHIDDASTRSSEPSKGAGRIVIDTQPVGARVLIDGKAAGESPLTLEDVPAGRHVLTFVSNSGTVKRTVKVVAGKTLDLDVPIFSGWVAVFAPIVLDVSEDGQSLGTTEESRLMLSPGHHRLTLGKRELGYSVVREIDIEAGAVTSLTLDPRGSASINAVPWAEIWIDGKKAGETPIANLQVPLGVREFVFKHSQFGERRLTTTIRADQPSALSVDFTKPQSP